MNRVEFMAQLERLLIDLPENERQDALCYYNDYFDDAGEENEGKVIQELGSPGKVAAIIRASYRNGSSGEDQESIQRMDTGTHSFLRKVRCLLPIGTGTRTNRRRDDPGGKSSVRSGRKSSIFTANQRSFRKKTGGLRDTSAEVSAAGYCLSLH